MTKRTNGAGRGKRHLSTSIPDEIRAQLAILAEQSGLTVSGYLRKAIRRTVEARISFQTIETTSVKP